MARLWPGRPRRRRAWPGTAGVERVEVAGDGRHRAVEQRAVVPFDHLNACAHDTREDEHAHAGGERVRREGRAQVLARDAYRCRFCGQAATEVDHIVPSVDGGTNHVRGLRSLCHACHAKR
ncbi:MAG: HNH endonuclease [Solirubrobacteraceae bacterium]